MWFLDQDNRELHRSDGWWPLRPGHTAGRLVGGNLSTLNLLQGTPYMPSLADAVLVVANADIGHTWPTATLLIGGQIVISADPSDSHLIRTHH